MTPGAGRGYPEIAALVRQDAAHVGAIQLAVDGIRAHSPSDERMEPGGVVASTRRP